MSALFLNYLVCVCVCVAVSGQVFVSRQQHNIPSFFFSFLFCVRITAGKGLAGDLAASECICGESSSRCGSDGMPLHMLERMVGYI